MEHMVDLSISDFGQWLKIVFAHEVPATEGEKEWYFAPDLAIQISAPNLFIRQVTRLFSAFRTIALDYSLEQLDQGIWLLLGPAADLGSYLMQPTIDRNVRIECIESMSLVYSEFVANLPNDVDAVRRFIRQHVST